MKSLNEHSQSRLFPVDNCRTEITEIKLLNIQLWSGISFVLFHLWWQIQNPFPPYFSLPVRLVFSHSQAGADSLYPEVFREVLSKCDGSTGMTKSNPYCFNTFIYLDMTVWCGCDCQIVCFGEIELELFQPGKKKIIYVLNLDWRFFAEIRWKWSVVCPAATGRDRGRDCRSCASWLRAFCCGTLGSGDGTGWHCKWTYLVDCVWNALVRFSFTFQMTHLHICSHLSTAKQVYLFNRC